MTWKPDVVIYHDPCLDGFTAAWAVQQRFPGAEYIGANYGHPVPDVAGKHVLIVDFSYKRAELDALANSAASVVILDHHKSAVEDLAAFRCEETFPGLTTPEDVPSMLRDLAELGRPPVIAIFDMNRSGARMAWDFCHGNGAPELTATPWLVLLVEDRDLWQFNYGDATRDFHLRLAVEPKTFEGWSVISAALPDGMGWRESPPVIEGAAMRRYRDWLVAQIASRAEIRPIGMHVVPVVDCPYDLASEVGHLLCAMHPDSNFAAMRSHSVDGTSFSLRSSNGFDVSAVAVRFGGGGHAGAAGFRVPPCI
jgi:oligoribonuclease NrnB/cAMP/cGMP phosphodiesterase (DHH superfamily)